MTRPTARRSLGTAGEGHARRFLEARGYRHVASQWRAGGCEIDLVMWHREELVFVEVKTRRGEARGRAAESVTPRQVRALMRAAEAYVATVECPAAEPVWRLDLVAVTLGPGGLVVDVSHTENAFTVDS